MQKSKYVKRVIDAMRDDTDSRSNDLFGGIKIGYARVSTDDQTLALQIDALKTAGCNQIYQETASGKQTDRPELTHALKALRKGDTLVVWRLDRLGRSMPHLVETIGAIERLGASFESLTEKIETSSATGRLVFHLFASLAEFERNLISERTKEGLKVARKRGNKGGRKPSLDLKAIKQVRALMADRSTRPADIASQYKISKSTLYKIVRTGV
jgi:DNA invertase Pin-like site-specific DNA recombinase